MVGFWSICRFRVRVGLGSVMVRGCDEVGLGGLGLGLEESKHACSSSFRAGLLSCGREGRAVAGMGGRDRLSSGDVTLIMDVVTVR